MKAHNKRTQDSLTPQDALDFLKEGNARFVQNLRANRNLLEQVNDTSEGQWPFAVILSCIDSRTSAELIFDQGLGDIFSVRIAGNIVNDDILGSMEYAVKYAGSKLVFVLGHTKCGAVTSACNGVEDGNITTLLNKVKPAIKQANCDHTTPEGVEKVAAMNVHHAIEEIRRRSTIIAEKEKAGDILLCGGMYSVDSGDVEFYTIPNAHA